MDENTVRESAQAHGDAVVAGNFDVAGKDLTAASGAQAPDVMKALPRGVTKAEVTSIEGGDDGMVVGIRYSNEDSATTVASTWQDVDGTPKIVNLEVL